MRREELEKLSTGDLSQIVTMAKEIIMEREAEAPLEKPAREVVERRVGKGSWLQLERVRCGNPSCPRCREGTLHGPYYYEYFNSSTPGRFTSRYIGKVLPPELAKQYPLVL